MQVKKVLIIDDEPLLVKSMCLLLKLKGFESYGAKDGLEGLKLAEEVLPDVVLLDIMMPGIDGWETLSRLKGNEKTRDIVVIVFTAREYSNGAALARSKGAIDMVTKPVESKRIASILQEIDIKNLQRG